MRFINGNTGKGPRTLVPSCRSEQWTEGHTEGRAGAPAQATACLPATCGRRLGRRPARATGLAGQPCRSRRPGPRTARGPRRVRGGPTSARAGRAPHRSAGVCDGDGGDRRNEQRRRQCRDVWRSGKPGTGAIYGTAQTCARCNTRVLCSGHRGDAAQGARVRALARRNAPFGQLASAQVLPGVVRGTAPTTLLA